MAIAKDLIKYLKISHEATNLFRQELPISFVEFQYLYEVSLNDGAHLNMLGSGRSVTHQGVGRHCAELESVGYVSMEPDARDQRAKMVFITPKGEEMLSQCIAKLENTYGARAA